MTARHRDDEPDAPTLQLDAIDPSVADAPNGVSLGALLGIQRRAYRQPNRLARIMRTSVVIVLWLGTAAGATAAAWTVHDLLHDDHVTDDVLLPNLDLRPAGTPTTVVAPILPNITLAPSSSSSDGAPATPGPSDVELRARTTADGTGAGGGNPSGGGRTTTTSAVGGSPSGAPTAGPTTRGSTAPTVGDVGGPDTTTGSSSGPGSGPGNPATTHDGSGNPNPSGPGTTPTTQNNSGPGGGGGGGGSPGGPPTTATPTVGPLITLSGTGGNADVRCTGDTIALLASRPLSGYNAEVQDTGPAKARVRFVSASAPTSKIEAHCAGGSLVRDVVQ